MFVKPEKAAGAAAQALRNKTAEKILTCYGRRGIVAVDPSGPESGV